MTTLKGKVALITGAGRGIGRAIAERYALLAAAVAVNYAMDERSAAERRHHPEWRRFCGGDPG